MESIPRKKVKVSGQPSLEKLYPHNVSIYKWLPTEDISYAEFKELISERLNLLRILENATLKHSRLLSPQWKESVLLDLNKEGLKSYVRLIQGSKKESMVDARRRDYISHFILRLAYCRTDELRKWFVARELEYFRYKFSNLTATELKQFIRAHKFGYVPLTEDEKSSIKDGLYTSSAGLSATNVEVTEFYKVHFTVVPALIKSRRCFVKGGYAYVSTNDFDSVISTELTKIIEEGLDYAFKILPAVEEDDRIYGLVKNLHTTYLGKDYSVGDGNKISVEHLEQLSKKSYPLCMRILHEGLKVTHHLKHGARMQLGLFLKGIGVSVEDSLRFWRQEFTKLIDLERFEKTYAYNIRHNYGREGSRVNYTPYSCMKVISTSVGPQENHGCPFKQLDGAVLKQKLSEYGVGKAHVQEIAAFASKGHYQLACGRYFECAHNTKNEIGVTHPNQYFELSQQLMKERTGADTPNSSQPSTPTTQRPSVNGRVGTGNNSQRANFKGTPTTSSVNRQKNSNSRQVQAAVGVGKGQDQKESLSVSSLTQSFLDDENEDEDMNSTLLALADSQA